MIVRVYTGGGSSSYGTPLLMEELARHLNADVAGITQDEINHSDQWKKETALLVFAGKSVTGFKAALTLKSLQNIKGMVAEGAFDYMGICAGKAFASEEIYYLMQNPVSPSKGKWISNTGLGFFNGLAIGPHRAITKSPFVGGSEDLALVTLHNIKDGSSHKSVYWGGPDSLPFSSADTDSVKIISTLQGSGTPMSLRLKFGQGNVFLCSHHPEITGNNIGRWADARMISPSERTRLDGIAAQLDGCAMKHFLIGCGLLEAKKMAAPAATLS